MKRMRFQSFPGCRAEGVRAGEEEGGDGGGPGQHAQGEAREERTVTMTMAMIMINVTRMLKTLKSFGERK